MAERGEILQLCSNRRELPALDTGEPRALPAQNPNAVKFGHWGRGIIMRALIGLCLTMLIAGSAWATGGTKTASPASATDAAIQKAVQAEGVGDYAMAFSILEPLAKAGNAQAKDVIWWMYYHGRGGPQDNVQALEWYRKVAGLGFADAQLKLGVMYVTGQGVPQDYIQAFDWLNKAASQGLAYAQLDLAKMYHNGQGVPQDYVQAAKWLIVAKAGGSTEAGKGLSWLEQQMTASQIAEAQRLASEWWASHHEQPQQQK